MHSTMSDDSNILYSFDINYLCTSLFIRKMPFVAISFLSSLSQTYIRKYNPILTITLYFANYFITCDRYLILPK